jgi:CheY-like chemotaxis protein
MESENVVVVHESDSRCSGKIDGLARRAAHGNERGLHVLVVEDPPCGGLASWLREAGHHVRVAADRPSAFREVRTNPPDVIVLDLDLVGPDGLRVARRLWGEAAWRRPFLVAVGGPGRPSDHRDFLEAGIHLHLPRPVDPDFLCRVLGRFQTVLQG